MTTDLCFKCSNENSILCMICGIAKDGAREHFKQKPITNADRIRAMTDEELAWRITKSIDCEVCKTYHNAEDGGCPGKPHQSCKDVWLEWLKQEAENA